MKSIHLFYFLLLLPIGAMAQPKVKRLVNEAFDPTNGWRYISRNDYTYNKSGQLTSNIRYNFDGEWYAANALISDFDDQGNPLRTAQYYQRQNSKDLYLYTETTYETGQDGCTSTEVLRYFMENGEMASSIKFNYFSNSDCRQDSIVGMRCDSIGGSFNCEPWYYVSNEFDADGNKTVENQGGWDISTYSFIRLDSAVVYQYNQSGQLISVAYSDINGPSSLSQFTYHPDGSRATNTFYNASDTGWELFYRDSIAFEYEYDDQGFVIRKKTIQYDLITTQLYSFESIYVNYCDGLPKVELWNGNIRTSFEYTEGVECIPAGEHHLLELKPNPTSSSFIVSYKGLERGKTHISLYNAIGSEVKDYNIWYRTDEIEVDVSQLPVGAYFLKIAEGKKIIGRKVLVSR